MNKIKLVDAHVLILRGLPGAGKSRFWREVVKVTRDEVTSADFYHEDEHGIYRFDPAKAGLAHDKAFHAFVSYPYTFKVVDNTNLSAWELAPYHRVAHITGRIPLIINFDVPLAVCAERQVHEVPYEKLLAMDRVFRTAELPPHWKVIRPEDLEV